MVRYTIALFGGFVLSFDQSVSQYTDCTGDMNWLSDGFCDSANNNLACGYDGGDCCECTCVDGLKHYCGFNGFNCLDPACPAEEPSPYPNCTGSFSWLSDGWCDSIETTNNPACGYDGGDCCACTCKDGPTHSCGSNGFDCDDTACLDLAIALQYPGCVDGWLSVGDGLCTAENNNQACGYDGGDCCLCTCNGSACVINDFDCLDPSAGDEIYDCTPPPPTPVPCSTDVQRVWVVENSTQARALGEAVNCSGGSFEVLWRGNVVVEQTFHVFDGTVLNVMGDSSIASMDGGHTTQLLTAVNASVNVTGVNMSYGAGIVGGAIAAVRSSLTFRNTRFFGNAAAGRGGAIYASDSSAVSFIGQNWFSENTAAMDGGAMFVSDSLCAGENVTFFNNTAGDDGGAVMVTEHSSLFWSGEAIYNGNRAGGAGGAISLQRGSSVVGSTSSATIFLSNSAEGTAGALALESGSSASWYGETIFDNNTALQHAGALHVLDDSRVWWNATTLFSRNIAGFTGGAIRVSNGSNASWRGSTEYTGNRGIHGGAMAIVKGSTASSGGNTIFSANTAKTWGGAAYVSDDSSVAWNGDTTFSRNLAGDGGAVFANVNSGISFGRRNAFHGNVAGSEERPFGIVRSGGAVAVRSSTLTVSGEITFTDNEASESGGAAYAAGATLLWTGRSSFFNNSCSDFGGALHFVSSTVGFDGNSTYYGNTATIGGAVSVSESGVAWGGNPEFINNSAVIGGALAVSNDSDVSWSGNMTLVRNRAFGNGSGPGSGGGLSVGNGSTVSWSGQAIFLNNSAGLFGGAMYLLRNGSAHWSGGTSFFGCTALFGGALYVVNGSAAEWSGPTEFTSNTAVFSGGAIGSSFLNERNNPDSSSLTFNGSTLFANNTAGATGGGLALNGMLSVSFHSPDVFFIGNSAEVVGGAVFVSSFGVGPLFSAVRFVANFAGAGGGAYVTGSGNEEINAFDTTPIHATRFDRCRFVDNWATATGGAIESVAGQDHISNTIFKGNTAPVGGALRLGGKTFLDSCSFVDNRSGEGAGPAIDNIGFVGRIADCSFAGNSFECQSSTYLDFNESGNVLEVACNGCRASCQGCAVEESLGVPTCIQAMQHSTSSGGGTTLETVSINPGFWRATSTSKDLLACYRDEACLGGVTGSPDYCANSYEGPYCSVCSDGYAASFGFVCGKCSDKAGGIVFTIVLVVSVVVGAAAMASYTMSSGLESGGRRTLERVMRFIPLQSIKIVIVALQIVTQFTAIANATYPHVYQRFLDAVNVLNFDFGWISQLSVGCLYDLGIHGRLLIATIGPIVALTSLGLTYIVAEKCNRGSTEALHLIRRRHVSVLLILTFLVYSSVSSILFQMFACDDLEDGKTYLRADYRVECDSSKHRAFQVYAGFMILFYTAGIPALYASLLFRNRRVLKDEVSREESQRMQSFSDLWKPYKSSIFYYEVIECGRRVLLTGTVVFIYPDTSAQIAVTLMIAFVFAMISEGLAPYASKWDTWISRMGHAVVYVSMYVALLLKVDVSNERSSSQKVFEAVLVAAHLGMILVVIVETGVMVCSLRETMRERILPRSRGTK